MQVIYDGIGLHNSGETVFPFTFDGFIVGSPGVVVQILPFGIVIPPAIACPGTQLIGTTLLQNLARSDAVESMFEGAECSFDNIILCIVIVGRHNLVVYRFRKVGACAEGAEKQCSCQRTG